MTATTVARQLVADISGRSVGTITAEDRLTDLGLDSLGRLTLAVLLEERTGQPVPDEVLLRVRTVGDLEQLLTPVGDPA
ncbi:acyl carrier protein [Dactylosporangium sp. CA-152071]|uniref:acyl carrier protein n=1 Tax=Dactylosporangium sp. CA-152071 TaxID=3239933 RepID=UPI003D91EE06